MIFNRVRSGASVLVALLLLLSSCGGGGDNSTAGIEGTGSPVATSSTVVASGSVTGFGSIYVNGTKFETDKASFTINGDNAAEDSIQVGMFVQIEGSRDKKTGESRAIKISYERNLLGPIATIEDIDGMTKRVTVLGQVIEISSDIVFEGVDFDSLAVNNIIGVSGFDMTENVLQATRIEFVETSNASSYELLGEISALNSDASMFTLNSQVIHFDAAQFLNGDIDQLKNGVTVKVISNHMNEDGSLAADIIRLKKETAIKTDTIISKEGTVRSFSSLSNFIVDDQKIDASKAEILRGNANQLAIGVHVTVEGMLDEQGVLVADTLRLKLPGKIKISGLVDNVDPTTGEFTVLDTTFKTDSLTVYEDRKNNSNRFININSINVGDFVKVFGKYIEGTLIAEKIKRENIGLDVEITLTGPVTRIESDSLFYVMGIMIDGTDAEGIEVLTTIKKGTKVEVTGVQIAPKSVIASRVSLLCKEKSKKETCEENTELESE